MDPYTVQILSICDGDHTKQNTQNKEKPQKHKPNKRKTKQKHQTKTRKHPHRRNGQVSSMRIEAAYVLIANVHAWSPMPLSSSRVSPVTHHTVSMGIRKFCLWRKCQTGRHDSSWSHGIQIQINGLVAAHLETIVSRIIPNFHRILDLPMGFLS